MIKDLFPAILKKMLGDRKKRTLWYPSEMSKGIPGVGEKKMVYVKATK